MNNNENHRWYHTLWIPKRKFKDIETLNHVLLFKVKFFCLLHHKANSAALNKLWECSVQLALQGSKIWHQHSINSQITESMIINTGSAEHLPHWCITIKHFVATVLFPLIRITLSHSLLRPKKTMWKPLNQSKWRFSLFRFVVFLQCEQSGYVLKAPQLHLLVMQSHNYWCLWCNL